jgi:poly(3-hydroxyalkanoate) synthetase
LIAHFLFWTRNLVVFPALPQPRRIGALSQLRNARAFGESRLGLLPTPEVMSDWAMPRKSDPGAEWVKWFWPTLFAAEAGVAFARSLFEAAAPPAKPEPQPQPAWTSPNRVVLELGAARLRRFDPAPGVRKPRRIPLLVCAPFALHEALVVDFCEGHSLIARLCAGGPVHLVEWLSASETQAFRGIDDYVADLNVMVDEIGGCCDFLGLCQGGWLALIHAGRFPAKTRKLVVAGSPVDTHIVESPLSSLALSTPIETFRELVRLGKGFARGDQAQGFWSPLGENAEQIHALLQSDLPLDSEYFAKLAARFRAWNARTVDLPGAYYLEVVEKLYKENQLARGAFVALGRTIDLRAIRGPLFLIAARDDEVAAPEQTFACARLVGTPAPNIRRVVVPGGHLHLFLGARLMEKLWPEVVAWLGEKASS